MSRKNTAFAPHSSTADEFAASSARSLGLVDDAPSPVETREETEARLRREWDAECTARMAATWAEMEAEARALDAGEPVVIRYEVEHRTGVQRHTDKETALRVARNLGSNGRAQVFEVDANGRWLLTGFMRRDNRVIETAW